MSFRKVKTVSSAPRLTSIVRNRKYAGRKDPDEELLGIGARAGGAQVLASLAGGTVEQAGIGNARLLAFARSETKTLACGLFRVILGTGLLIPVGTASIEHEHRASREQIERLMARAADQAAFLLLNSREAMMPQRMHRRRTTAAGRFVLWSNAIIGIAERTELEAAAGADREAILSGSRPSERSNGGTEPDHHPATYALPQLLGIWVTVSQSHLEQIQHDSEPADEPPELKSRPSPSAQHHYRHSESAVQRRERAGASTFPAGVAAKRASGIDAYRPPSIGEAFARGGGDPRHRQRHWQYRASGAVQPDHAKSLRCHGRSSMLSNAG